MKPSRLMSALDRVKRSAVLKANKRRYCTNKCAEVSRYKIVNLLIVEMLFTKKANKRSSDPRGGYLVFTVTAKIREV
jgi:hypothetical protein